MKAYKRILALALVLALAMSLAACGTFETKLMRAARKMQDTESLHMDMDVSFEIALGMLGSNVNMDFSLAVASDMFTDPLLAKMETTMSSMGESGHILSYAEKTDENYTLYVSADNGATWQNQSVSLDQLPSQLNASTAMQQIGLFADSAHSFQEVGTEKINGSDAKRYDGLIEGSAVSKALELSGVLEAFSSQFGAEIDLNEMESGSIPASLWIDAKTGYIVRYDLDMTEIMALVMKNVLASTMESAGLEDMEDLISGIELRACTASVTLSQFNEIEVFQIPDEAKTA